VCLFLGMLLTCMSKRSQRCPVARDSDGTRTFIIILIIIRLLATVIAKYSISNKIGKMSQIT
jgi:hypothetical protein